MELDILSSAVIDGDHIRVNDSIRKVLEQGTDPEKILNGFLIPAMEEVGARFEKGEIYVPEMMISARAMQVALDELKPHLVSKGVKPIARVALGTVKGDLHNIGKNLVGMMLEGAGFEVLDLGVDVPPERFTEAVKEDGASIIAMSALLTTTMEGMKEAIDILTAAGLRKDVQVIIGGAPLTEKFAEAIGADAFGPDAAAAPRLLKALLGL
jgi:5-methyltetrahydrofolate--homocysteine methyltransferase